MLAGAATQSATGFGFALVAVPLVVAAYEPAEAVSIVLVLGVLVNVLMLGTEGRRPEPLWLETGLLLACMAPGAVAGAAILDELDDTLLQILVSVSVVAALVVRWRARRAETPIAAVPWLPVAGISAGALTTTTTTNGPPLLLYLLGRRASPNAVRHSLGVLFVTSGLIGLGGLVVSGTGISLPGGAALAALLAATVLGQVAGRRLFARLAAGRYDLVAASLLATSAITGVVLALT